MSALFAVGGMVIGIACTRLLSVPNERGWVLLVILGTIALAYATAIEHEREKTRR